MLREVATSLLGAALLFQGELHTREELKLIGERALLELRELGYSIPSPEKPVTVLPLHSGMASASHAGGWTPGTMYLRVAPHSTFNESVYLRHELMHEVVYRSCRDEHILPTWAEESIAIAFSGEASKAEPEYSQEALSSLKKAVRIGSTLTSSQRKVLTALIHVHGWPMEPCRVSPVIQKILTAPIDDLPPQKGSGKVDYILMHVSSGRIFSSHGEIDREHAPIGSIHKIPYLSFLKGEQGIDVGRSIVRSHTESLASARSLLSIKEMCRLLLFPSTDRAMQRYYHEQCQNLPTKVLLGESDSLANFPFQYTLMDAARVIRIALQVKIFNGSGSFPGIPPHSDDSKATLYTASKDFHRELSRLDGWAKTGTVSSKEGVPLWGHLLIAWPQRNPTFIALFRSPGVRGASIAEEALPVLRTFKGAIARSNRPTVLPVISTLPKAAYTVEGECSEKEERFSVECMQSFSASSVKFSWSGNWRVTTKANYARPVRYFRGTLLEDKRILITDPLTYTDAVSVAEGGGLPKATSEALRAVIFWNATKGRVRHPPMEDEDEKSPLFSPKICDTTHCMVFMGETNFFGDGIEGSKKERYSPPSEKILETLDRLDLHRPLAERGWFEFSTGGETLWHRRIPLQELRSSLQFPELADIKRFRRRDGVVEAHLVADLTQQVVTCDQFQVQLNLPSCPDRITKDIASSTFLFEGMGSGHGRGLLLSKGRELAQKGATTEEILLSSY